MVVISEFFISIVWLVWEACSDSAAFFLAKPERLQLFGFLLNSFQTDVCLSDISVFAVLARDGINKVVPLLPRYRMLIGFEKIWPTVCRCSYGFRNAPNVRDNRQSPT